MDDLNGRVAVVTGAASGIGLAATERFLKEGMKVVMADIEQGSLEREVARLSAAGKDVLGVRCDVRDPDAVNDLRDRTLAHYGSCHVVFNNAGVAPVGPMLETTPADWRWIFDVNVMGVAHGVMTFGPLFVEQGEGHIINTASEAGHISGASIGMYVATKHAVVGLSESLFRELEGTGVGVHCLCPNLVQTKIFESERNRDDAAEPTAAQIALSGPLREVIATRGITPAQVSDDIVAAMKANQFWIFTHEITKPAIALRHEDIQANRNPTSHRPGDAVLEDLLAPPKPSRSD